MDQLLQRIITCSKHILNVKSKAIFLLNDDKLTMRARIIDGIFPPIFGSIPADVISKVATKQKYIQELIMKQTIPLTEKILGEALLNKEAILIPDVIQDGRITQPPVDFLQAKTLMVAPLVLRDEIMGAMVAVNTSDNTPFTESDLSLFSSLADQAAFCIYSARQYRIVSEKERLDRELEIAAEVQNLLLPHSLPKVYGFDMTGMNQPALEMGGDYYDFFPVGNNLYGIAIADVSGKGVPAALLMTMARSILRTHAPGKTSSRAVLGELNSLLYPDIRQDMFISLIYMILDTKTFRLTISRAGHEPILYYDHSESTIQRLKPQGIVLGMDVGPLFISTIEEVSLQLDEGDILVLYTD
ncbi:MAG: SpoIIE family protein phosphatase, partial [Chlamydiota bacterium]|nr:SpoIIE family protein phosphatase [Chlamydiota bacterium]